MKNRVYMPHPATLLFIATLSLVLLSWIGSVNGWPVQNMLSVEGVRLTLRHAMEHLRQSPLIPVFVLLTGISLAYASGMLKTLLRQLQLWRGRTYLSHRQRRALQLAVLAFIVYVVCVAVATFSPFAILLGVTGTLNRSPFIEGIVPIVALAFMLPGTLFGIASGTFRNDRDILVGMSRLPIRFIDYFIYLLVTSLFLGTLQTALLDVYFGIGKDGMRLISYAIYYIPLVGKLLRMLHNNKLCD